MKPIKIGTRLVGPGHPTLVIAEIGVNHDGVLQRALDLVRIAAGCGADAVKLQIFRAVNLLNASSMLAQYQQGCTADNTPIDLLRRYELSSSDLRLIVREIVAHKMIPLATPFSPPDYEVLETLRVQAIKIASPDLVNRPLLQCAKGLNKPLLISTGAADMEEVTTTTKWMEEWGIPFALLHCVSAYPAPSNQAHLCWIGELAGRFSVPVGYSDHTTEPLCGALSVAAGATIVERHLTYDRAARGPDHASSSDPAQFQRYVRLLRDAEAMRGAAGKKVLEIEQDIRKVSRQSLVARRTLSPGDILCERDLTVQRPGTGMPAAQIEQAVGRRLNKAVLAGSLLQWDMLDAA
ncbi:MAG TPA: N-acetylneuraminate synthase family protein [Tepidisphaeraceae bacterium]|jgi:N-acetylneuraminate synthase/N,N'-diacetyllegionaminate synthase|nr:N-acetylneuraminate synthase family protein [Tepidisphaeraceae bacterium]